ncbi:MAG: hypothetical protein ACK46A_13115 [Akkermansiaceae bacterium]|jgi:hypothetical protein
MHKSDFLPADRSNSQAKNRKPDPADRPPLGRSGLSTAAETVFNPGYESLREFHGQPHGGRWAEWQASGVQGQRRHCLHPSAQTVEDDGPGDADRQWSYGAHFMKKSDNGKPNEPLPAQRVRIA